MNNNEELTGMALVINALDFAAFFHKDQRRKNKDKDPYINHPIEVAKILTDCGVNDPNIIAAAILHDVIEDTRITIEDLANVFPTPVINYVKEVTDDKSLPKVEIKKRQLEKMKTASDGAKMIKAADKISNCSNLFTDPPESWSVEYQRGYFTWCYYVCEEIKGVNKKLDEKIESLFSRYNNYISPSFVREYWLQEYYKMCSK